MSLPQIVLAEGEAPIFEVGDNVRVDQRFPIGHFRVPNYIRGKRATVVGIITPPAINNEEEGYGRNAGSKPVASHHSGRTSRNPSPCRTPLGPTFTASPLDVACLATGQLRARS